MSVFNRAEVVDRNFTSFVLEGRFPKARSVTRPSEAGLSRADVLDFFESQVISRQLDLVARELKNRGESYYTIGSSGHEGNAALGKVFRPTDMAFLHYRSGAFMVHRSKHLEGATPIYDMLLSLTASKEDPIAGGRHKVFGSLPLLVPPQTSTIASHLPKAVGAALSVCRARDLKIPSVMPKDAVVTCSFGDASANHSTALGAINSACWVAYQNVALPLVFICEDNDIGISVSTPKGWIHNNFSQRPELLYLECDGLNICDVYLKARLAEQHARIRKRPVFLHVHTVRLLGHAGSDVETTYHELAAIEATEANDPLLHSARLIAENNYLQPQEIVDLYHHIQQRVRCVAEQTVVRPKLQTPEEVRCSITSCQSPRKSPKPLEKEERSKLFGKDFDRLSTPQHMAKLINWGLVDIMGRYNNTVVFGEDVAQKGGVYHVTDDLYKKFGPKRVFNSLLDEQSILGTAIGMAHNGFVPIPEIQFLAYVHNAEDQIRGEAATLAFFSEGRFTNPMVIRVAGLGYQKGFGGHFHNDNSLAVFRDIPGIILAVPSNGADAVKMMRTCVRLAYECGRVCVFVEPIALYMTKDLHENGDKLWCFPYPDNHDEIGLGEVGVYGAGEDFVVLTYGNGVYYSLQAMKELEEFTGMKTKVVDLRWLAPLNKEKILPHLKTAKKVLIVDECRKTGSLSEQLVTLMVEEVKQLPPVKVVAADDCFIPLGPAAAAGLPKKAEIFAAAKELIGVTV